MDQHQKTSKMDAFEERIRKCARDMEKVRSDYLKECSEYYDKNLNRFVMREKRIGMKWDKLNIDLLIGNQEHAFRHVKMRRRREERQREKRKQEEREQEALRLKRKKVRPSDPFGVKTGNKGQYISEPAAAAE